MSQQSNHVTPENYNTKFLSIVLKTSKRLKKSRESIWYRRHRQELHRIMNQYPGLRRDTALAIVDAAEGLQ